MSALLTRRTAEAVLCKGAPLLEELLQQHIVHSGLGWAHIATYLI